MVVHMSNSPGCSQLSRAAPEANSEAASPNRYGRVIAGLGLIFLPVAQVVSLASADYVEPEKLSRSDPSRSRSAPSVQDVDDLLVLRFDDSLSGEDGESPVQAVGVVFESGVSNSGALLPAPSELLYAGAGNINPLEGSLECWFKPTWDGNDYLSHYLLRYGGAGGILIGKDGANNLRIILNRYGAYPGGEAGIFLNVGDWQANEWHHIAFTWSDSAKTLQLYIDGTLIREESFAIALPPISSPNLQIGADGASAYAEGVVDNLRISGVVSSPQEILDHMLEGLTVTSWSMDPPSGTVELWPTWYWWVNPTVTAETNAGTLTLPASAASWSSTDPSVAVMELPAGRVKALAPGTAVLTGSLGGQEHTITVDVVTPARAPVEEDIDLFLETPAAGHLYKMPVVILRYFPTTDGVSLDPVLTGISSSLIDMKAKAERMEKQIKFVLEEGGRFRGYGNPAAFPTLGYEVVKIVTIYEDVPPGFVNPWEAGTYFPDYNQILTRWGSEELVNEGGVKEFWIWHQHFGRIAPNESNMSSPTTGDISNSARSNGDQPIHDRTFVTYGITLSRDTNEAVHNHGHQLEAILSQVNWRQDGNFELFWQRFVGQDAYGQFQQGRCGDTHHPPNAASDYDYYNTTAVRSDIEDWTPEQLGQQTWVAASTWGGIPYDWPDDLPPPGATEAQWYLYWMQAMPGRDNGVPFGTNTMTNWWQFTGDWDAASMVGLGLYESALCTYELSAATESIGACGGPGSTSVTAGSGCRWIASSNEPWIRLTSGRTGDGDGSVTFTVAVNDGAARSGTIAVAGQLFTVTQSEAGIEAPGEVTPLTLQGRVESQLSWPATPSATYYDVAKGDLVDLRSGSYGGCLEDDLPATGTTDSSIPAPGAGYFYLVRGINGSTCAAGSYGTDSDGEERLNDDPAACP